VAILLEFQPHYTNQDLFPHKSSTGGVSAEYKRFGFVSEWLSWCCIHGNIHSTYNCEHLRTINAFAVCTGPSELCKIWRRKQT